MKNESAGHLSSKPRAQKNLGSSTTGLRRTGLDTERDGILYVPESFNPKVASALIVILHGAGGDAMQSLTPIRSFADRAGAIVLAPESQGRNWDFLEKGFGADVEFIDEALSDAFALYNIDPTRVAIGGFAEGANYARALGQENSDLFTHILPADETLPAVLNRLLKLQSSDASLS
jgi:phospholipase/carboxylesterase